MSRYCVDTSAYSRFQLGERQVIEILDAAEWIGMPAIALGELRTGFLAGGRSARNEAELRAFLENPVVATLVVDDDVSRHYAAMLADLRRAGTPIPTNDIWIAATAARSGALVLTFDRHFGSIDRVGSVILGQE